MCVFAIWYCLKSAFNFITIYLENGKKMAIVKSNQFNFKYITLYEWSQENSRKHSGTVARKTLLLTSWHLADPEVGGHLMGPAGLRKRKQETERGTERKRMRVRFRGRRKTVKGRKRCTQDGMEGQRCTTTAKQQKLQKKLLQ